jgi:hypothetical protein
VHDEQRTTKTRIYANGGTPVRLDEILDILRVLLCCGISYSLAREALYANLLPHIANKWQTGYHFIDWCRAEQPATVARVAHYFHKFFRITPRTGEWVIQPMRGALLAVLSRV